MSTVDTTTYLSSLDALVKAKPFIPQYEYLLHGSILDSSVDILLLRLKGLCDNVAEGKHSFHDHEICFSLRSANEGTSPLHLRVRRAIDVEAPYQLRYIGRQELGDRSQPTLVRHSLDIACTWTVLEYLQALGCSVDYEYNIRGFMFQKGRMKITVSKIFKKGDDPVPNEPNGKYADPITQSHLVEMSVITAKQDGIDKEMAQFAEKLKPLVNMQKIDYRRLGVFP